MKIIEKTWQHRNDFSARMECEHCGHNQELKDGYNDVYYHTKVIPNLKCLSCQKTRNDLTPSEGGRVG